MKAKLYSSDADSLERNQQEVTINRKDFENLIQGFSDIESLFNKLRKQS